MEVDAYEHFRISKLGNILVFAEIYFAVVISDTTDGAAEVEISAGNILSIVQAHVYLSFFFY